MIKFYEWALLISTLGISALIANALFALSAILSTLFVFIILGIVIYSLWELSKDK